jgi:PAS domain S-box-containing protein
MGMKGKPEKRTEYGNIHEKELLEESHKQALLIAELLEKSGQPFAVSDQNGSIGIYNPAFLELTGYSPEELKNIKWTSVPMTTPEWFESESKALAQLDSTGKPVRYEKEMVRKDGTRISIEVWANSLRDESGKQQYRYAFISDITARKKAEDELKTSEEKFRNLFNNAEVGMFRTRSNGSELLDLNQKYCEMLGYNREEIIGTPSVNLWADPQERARMVTIIQAQGSVTDFECCLMKRNGETMHCLTSLWLYPETGILEGSIIDITHRLLAEQALEFSEERFRRIFDEAPIGAAITSPDFHFIRTNGQLSLMLGYTPEEFAKLTFKEITYPDDLSTDVEQIARLMHGEIQHYNTEKRYLHKDGTVVWGHLSLSPIRDAGGKIICFVPQIIDITERKRAEEELRQSEERHQAIIQTAMDGFWMSDMNERILEVNETYCRMSGYSAQELLAMRIPDMEATETATDTASHMRNIVEEGEHRFESRHRRKDGSIFDVEVSTQYHPDKGGRFVSFFRDITELKRAEAENLQLRDKAEMSNRLAAVGEMAAGIAHEINNPLTAVIGFSELLMEEDLPSEMKAQLKIISDGSHRVKDIVRRMLTFSRQIKPIKACVDINDLIDATLDLRSYVLRTANIEVVKHFDPDLHCVIADAGQMQQVFLNLIVNAEYSMKQAHGKGTLTITTEKADDHVHILFQDDGMGMSNLTKEKLFNPFFTTKGVDEGTGLGLSVSRSIILEHNGTIEVESEPGKGATFIITLPINQPSEEGETKAEATEQISASNVSAARILVVDDEEPIRKLVSTILAKSGHTVETTGDAREALVKMDSASYDVVLIDIRMPGMSGMELYNDVKLRRPELAGRFIFITGDTSDENTRNFFGKNELSYLTKPFDRNILTQKVNGILER